MLKLIPLVFVLLVLNFCTADALAEIERYVIDGSPIIATHYESSICDSYELPVFRKIQIEYGLIFANSALQCRFSKDFGLSRQTAFLAIDPISKCGLDYDPSTKDIFDPCSKRIFDSSGQCIGEKCEVSLIQIYATNKDEEFRILEVGTTIVEFDGIDKLQISAEKKLAIAMINNSELTIDKVLKAGNLDVNFIYQDEYSLLEIAIQTNEEEVLRYLLENGAEICVDCISMIEHLINSLKSGSLNISAILIEFGVKPGEICDELFFPEAKQLIGCG